MTEIDFDNLVSEISEGLDSILNEMFSENARYVDEAVETAKRDIIREIRMAFDQAEAMAEIEERFRTLQQEMLQLQSRIENLIQTGRTPDRG